MKALINIIKLLIGLTALFSIHACTSLQTFPAAARAGDTISFAVGSASGMTKSSDNTTAQYITDEGVTYPLAIRSVFNLYPDKKSSLYQPSSTTTFVIDSSGHEAWQTVMVVDLPGNLPVGTGHIKINSVATLPTISSQINDVEIGLEIIAGAGYSSSFDYEFGLGSSKAGDLSLLEPLPHAVVEPPFIEDTYYGAIELRMNLPNTAGQNRPLLESEIKVVVDDMTASTLSNRSVVWRYVNNELIILLLSPTGELVPYEARYSIVLPPRISFSESPSFNNIIYYDYDGNIVSGPLPDEYYIQLF